MRKVLGIGILALTLAVFSSAAEARGDGGPKGDGAFKGLDLTKEQKEKMKELQEGRRDKMKELREKMHAAQKAFMEKMDSNADDDDIREAHDAVSAAKSKIEKERFEGQLAMRKILTKEQKEKMKKMRGKRERGHRGMHRPDRDED